VIKGSETVLLVDDEEIIRGVGQELLKAMGYRSLVAESGKEALEVYERHKNEIDLVILDMVMPAMGGGETFDQLKEINPDIKVILSSGYSINGEASEIMDRGCSGFIQKPFDMNQLSETIRSILENS
jgi:DNA-binding NtrC family response regulator